MLNLRNIWVFSFTTSLCKLQSSFTPSANMKMMMNPFIFLLLSSILATCSYSIDVSYDGRAIKIDGRRKILLSGSIHYPRSSVEMWPSLIRKAKEGGLDAVETYVFWNAHEAVRRNYNFSGNLDFIKFLKIIQDEGLYSVLRIGPYICAEWNYGGLPVWLHNIPGIELRTANEVFMNEMQNFTTLIVDMVKRENLFASQGGSIILAQIENEYGNVISSYGDAGITYMNWCANFANSLDIGVPWIMCKQKDAPPSVINTCNGYYCDDFTPNNPNSPKMWTENWSGWYKHWGGKDPLRTAEDLAFSVARFYQRGGTFMNYYMYQGGTNFGRSAGGPYITTSYDFDAPLNEYGTLNQPKYGHLKQLHDVLHSMENTLTYGNVSSIDFGNSVWVTTYTDLDKKSCFISNTNRSTGFTVIYQGVNYTVPAWSVSILPDCKNEVYNTAKVNTQTSIIVKKSNETSALVWQWKPEVIEQAVVSGIGELSAYSLLDQKFINDTSDYLWYMTSVDIEIGDRILTPNMTLRINATGHMLHAYVNGKLIGSQWPTHGVPSTFFEEYIQFNPGKNQIALLSVTVGEKHYGPRFDMVGSGIPGPVEIVGRRGDELIVNDLSHHNWTYKAGLDGFKNQFFNPHTINVASQWIVDDLPIDKRMIWYKTTFKAPPGDDPVAVDMLGLGKGEAWVNGRSIGRYWPSYLTAEDGCSDEACDYRGPYHPDKCTSNCGKPTQRWYHVPRSFMDADVNELVVFEEIGGNPRLVNFVTVREGIVCGGAYENHYMELTCHGRPISGVEFAAFGDVNGHSCPSYQIGSCVAASDHALSIVKNACLGKEACSVLAAESVFGATNCDDSVSKRLVVHAIC